MQCLNKTLGYKNNIVFKKWPHIFEWSIIVIHLDNGYNLCVLPC